MKHKICLVFHGTDYNNGGCRSFIDIVDYLISTNKYEFIAIFPGQKGTAIDYFNSLGIKTYTFKYGFLMQDLRQSSIKRAIKFPLYLIRMISTIVSAKKASKIIKKENVDLIYSNTSTIVFGGYLGLFDHIKQVWHIREYRVLDHQISFFLGEKWIKSFINRCASKVFFVSKGVLNYNTDYIDINKCFVTFNSYSKQFISPKASLFSGGKMTILVAGDVRFSKGQHIAIEAISIIKKTHPNYEIQLLVAGRLGEGKYKDRILNLIKENDLEEQVQLLGYRKDMKEIRSISDVGLCTSQNEAFGRTVIEGMLSNVAMIGRSSGGTIEQITHLKTGLLYDGSPKDLAEKIIMYYESPELLKKCTESAFVFAVNNFTNNNSAKIVEGQIDLVL